MHPFHFSFFSGLSDGALRLTQVINAIAGSRAGRMEHRHETRFTPITNLKQHFTFDHPVTRE
jgi:hypothetical protein